MFRRRSTYKIIRDVLYILPSLFTGLGDLIAGSLLAIIASLLAQDPFLLLLYPQLLSFRGSVSGVLMGRHSTSLHLGTIKPNLFKDNTEEYYTLLFTVFILFIIGSLLMSILTEIWLILIYKNYSITILTLFLFMQSVAFIAALIAIPIKIFINNFSFKMGYDPDVISYPAASTIGDLSTTLTYIILVFLLLKYNLYSIFIVIVLISIIFPFIFIKKVNYKMFKKEFSESIASLVITSFIVGVTGNVFRNMQEFLKKNIVTYIIYPAFITLAGDAGSIIGSKATTRLSLGGFRKGFWDFYLTETSIILLGSLTVLLIITGYAYILTFTSLTLIILIIIAGLITISIISLYSLLTAYLTFTKGLDPDHFVNPLTSVSADMFATIVLASTILLTL